MDLEKAVVAAKQLAIKYNIVTNYSKFYDLTKALDGEFTRVMSKEVSNTNGTKDDSGLSMTRDFNNNTIDDSSAHVNQAPVISHQNMFNNMAPRWQNQQEQYVGYMNTSNGVEWRTCNYCKQVGHIVAYCDG